METGAALKRLVARHLSETGAKWTPETGWTNDPVAYSDQQDTKMQAAPTGVGCDLKAEWLRLSESLLAMADEAVTGSTDPSAVASAGLCLADARDLHRGGAYRAACLRSLHSMSYTLGVLSAKFRNAHTLYKSLTSFNTF